MRTRLVALALGLWLALAPFTARAACTNPPGSAGDQIYNSTANAMQYCNGSVWVNMGTTLGFGTLTSGDICTTDGTNVNCTTAVPLTVPNGGTGQASFTAHGILIGEGASALSITTAGTAGQLLTSEGSTTDPTWTTATFPATTTANQILYSNATNTVTGLATANSSVLVTNGSGVPSLSTTLPAVTLSNGTTATTQSESDNSTKVATTAFVAGIQTLSSLTSASSLATVGTITSGTWTGATIAVANGGTGQTSAQAARGSVSANTIQGLNIDEMTTHGDNAYNMAVTDRVVATSAALTAARTWNLPLGSQVNAGQTLCVVDKAGGVTSSNTLTIAAASGSSDTVNPSTSATIKTAYGSACFTSDGGTPAKWTAVGGAGIPGGSNTYVQYNSSGAFGGDSSFTYAGNGGTLYIAGNVGIGTTAPQSLLHIYNGEVQVGSSGGSCSSATAGAIRYSSGALSYCNGTSYTGPTAAAAGSSGNIQYNSGSNTMAAASTFTYTSGNVGIGTTAPQAALQVNSLIQVGNTANNVWSTTALDLEGGNGTLYALNLASASGNTAIQLSGTNAVVQGKLGVNGQSPSGNVDILASGTYTSPVIQLRQGNAAAYGVNMGIDENFDGGLVFSTVSNGTASPIMDIDRGTPGVVIGNGYVESYNPPNNGLLVQGNVGIGTTAPGAKLDVAASLQSAVSSIQQTVSNGAHVVDYMRSTGGYVPGLTWYSVDNNITKPKAGIWIDDTGSGSYLQFGTSNAYTTGVTNTALTIDPIGRVGIGNTSPSGILDVSGSGSSLGVYFHPTLSSAGQGLQIDTTNLPNGSNGIYVSEPSGWTGNTISSNLNGAQQFRIDQAGNAYFSGVTHSTTVTQITRGNGKDYNTAVQNHVFAATWADGGSPANTNGPVGGLTGILIGIDPLEDDGAGGQDAMEISQPFTGSIYWRYQSGGTWQSWEQLSQVAVSSRRFKHNIEPLTISGLQTVMAMRPVTFTYNANAPVSNATKKQQQIGFIAEDVEKIDPRLIEYDDRGEINTVRYGQYTAVLTKAIQELKADNDNLRAELKSANDNFKTQTDELHREIVELKKEVRAR